MAQLSKKISIQLDTAKAKEIEKAVTLLESIYSPLSSVFEKVEEKQQVLEHSPKLQRLVNLIKPFI